MWTYRYIYLSLIGSKYNPNKIGLYRGIGPYRGLYRGLAVFKNTSGSQSEKSFQNMFKNKRLDIIIECNLKILNYLDVT